MKFLVIQTAFIGDVILATPIVESISLSFPHAQIDFMLRKGNESLLKNHPKISHLYIWDKSRKYASLNEISKAVRRAKYEVVINLQRFGNTGYLTWRSGAKNKIGFDKNPFSFCYQKKVRHEIGNGKHEVKRNLELLEGLCSSFYDKPKLYTDEARAEINDLMSEPYVCIAPASVWFTKQFPASKWQELIVSIPNKFTVFLIGSKSDQRLCEQIKTSSGRQNLHNLAGKFSLLASAALMQHATMNYVNDSAPMHLCSAVDAPVTAVFCSTVPSFGFGPLSTKSRIIETGEVLSCRPCGLHGYSRCPQGHFKCATGINISQLPLPS